MFQRNTIFAIVLVCFIGCQTVLVSALPYRSLQEAESSALSSAAGAAAAAAAIDSSKQREMDRYGYETGVPLLARPVGPLTNLYAAALPPGNFVIQLDPAFVKDSYGNVKHIGDSRTGVLVA